MENNVVCGINRSVENRKNTAECGRQVKTNITEREAQLITRVRKCVALTAVLSAVIEATRCVASWRHGEQYEYENITPCGTFLFKVSDHNVLCLNHSKGKVKLDFFLIKAIFWIKPFFQFLLCHFIPFFYPLWRKDLKLPTLTVCCGIWVVAFVTSSGGGLVFVPFCPITTSATNQAFLNWTRSRCILGKSASACSMNREHMYLCIIDVLVQSWAALLAQSWMGGGAL